MVKPGLGCNKFYFLLRFRAIFLKVKYVSLIKASVLGFQLLIAIRKGLMLIRTRAAELQSLLPDGSLRGALSSDFVVLGCNEYCPLEEKEGLHVTHCFFFSGHFINAAFISKLNMVYHYYRGNYNCYIFLTKKSVNLYLCGVLLHWVRFALTLNFAKQKK